MTHSPPARTAPRRRGPRRCGRGPLRIYRPDTGRSIAPLGWSEAPGSDPYDGVMASLRLLPLLFSRSRTSAMATTSAAVSTEKMIWSRPVGSVSI